nr:reverse transcriptase domain-containing protein [Tanacetum cinerariifolium]
MAAEGTGDLPVPDLRTMEELCQPSLNGQGGPTALIAIQTNFRLKNDMIQQVQNSCQFYGLPGDDSNKHLDKFLHVTQSIKVNGVTDDALRLYLFPHSLTHHATAWFDRLPRNTINTFEQMDKMFLEKYFPPSMVTKLRNEITNFRQHLDESLFEAWEHYKLSIDQCPNHNMLPVTQIDTFYNGLTLRHRDTIHAAAGGTFMKRRPKECYDLIENVTAHQNDWDTSAQRTTVGNTQNVYAAGAYQGNSYQPQGNRNLLSYRSDNYLGPQGFNQNQNRNNQNQNFHNQNRNQGNHNPHGNNQGRNQFFQGASHGQNPPPAYQALGYQAPVHQPQIPQPQVVTTNEFTNLMKANDAILKNMQTNMTSLTNSNLELKNMFGLFMKMNTVSSSGSGTLSGNTITNPKEDMKGITTQSGTAYQGPTIPTTFSSLPPVVERETEATKDMVHPTNDESTKDPVASPVSASKPNQRPLIPYPSRLHDQKLRDKTNDQREKFFQIFKDLNFNIRFAIALILMPNGSPKEVARKTGGPDKFLIPCDFPGMAECLALADLGASINLMPLSVWNTLPLPDLSPMCMTLELVDHFDADPRVPLIPERSFLKTGRALIDVFEANYNDMTANRIDVIDMACEEYSQEVLGFSDVTAKVDAFLALEDDPTSPEVDQRPEECYDLIENMTAHHNDWDTSAQRSESSSSITSSSDTEIAALKAEMGSNQGQNQLSAYQAPAYQASVYQDPVHQPQIPQPQVVTTNESTNFIKANDAILKNMQTNMTSLTNSNLELKNMFDQFMKMNTASSSGSGTLPGNTITNPKEDLKGITNRRGTAYPRPMIPTTSSLVVERKTEATKNTVHPTNNGSTEDVQPPVVQSESLILVSESVISPIIEHVASPVSASRPNQRPSIPYPSRF